MKSRISNLRSQSWDYRSPAEYFVTICTRNKQNYFGEIQNGKMQLSHLGLIADIMWYEIKNHANHIELGEFFVMPNHIHGIVKIVGTTHALSLQNDDPLTVFRRFQNQGKNSLSSIIGSYKSAVSKHAHRLGFAFEWQPRFYDHIIRDVISLEKISNYIRTNASRWKEDKFYR